MPRSPTARGLGWRHQPQVTALLSVHVDGSPCWWCGKPMFREADRNFDGRPLSGDHSVPRAAGGTETDRLLHATCNSERGDGSRDEFRPALAGSAAAQPLSDLGTRLMPWPW